MIIEYEDHINDDMSMYIILDTEIIHNIHDDYLGGGRNFSN